MINKKISLLKFLFVGLSLLIFSNLAFAQGTVNVTLPTETGQIGVAEWIDVAVGPITTSNNVKQWGFDLTYDPAVLQINDVSISGTVSDGGFKTQNLAYAANKVRVGYINTTPINAPSGGTLVKIQVTPLAAGTSTLDFEGTFAFGAGATITPVVNIGSYAVGALNVDVVAPTGKFVGDDVEILINTDAITAGSTVKQFEFTFNYDPAVFQFTDAVLTGTMSEGGFRTVGGAAGAKLIGWISTAALAEGSAGTLIKISGSILAKTAGSNFTLTGFKYGLTGVPSVSPGAGSIIVINRAPVFDAITDKTVAEGSELSFVVNAVELDGDALTYSMVDPGTGAQFNAGTETFTWTPTFLQASATPYVVTFNVDDGDGGTATVNANITVTDVNHTPTIALNPVGPFTVIEGNEVTFAVVGTEAIDTDNTLTYSSVDKPTGSVLNEDTGVFTWTPGFAAQGVYTVNFVVTDNHSATATISTTITVTDTNSGPSFVLPGAVQMPDTTIREGQLLQFTYKAIDLESDPITYFMNAPSPASATIGATTGIFGWKPVIGDAGDHQILVMASDGLLSNPSRITKVTVIPNEFPVFTSAATQTVAENALLTFDVTATDADDPVASLVFTAANVPTGAAFTGNTFTWTPTFDQAGSYTVTFTVVDPMGGTKTQDVVITVTNTNRAPSLVLNPASPYTVAENTNLNFTLVGTDADGDVMIYSAVNMPTGATLDATTGVFAWVPTFEQAGSFTVTFTVTDDEDASSAGVDAVITVTSTNRAPQITLTPAGPYTLAENVALEIAAAGTDADMDALTLSTSTLPTGATFNAATGAFAWTPTYLQAGTYSVTFYVTDGILNDSTVVTITVTDVNRTPAIVLNPAGPYNVTEGEELVFNPVVSDVDTDNTQTITYSELPVGATYTSGIFNWTPNYTQHGTYTVVFTVTDNYGASANVTATINVADVNRAPEFVNTPTVGSTVNVELVYDSPIVTYTFTYTAIDPDADPVEFSLEAGPDGSSITVDGVFSWAPRVEQAGESYAVTVKVSDGHLYASHTVNFTVASTITSIEDKTEIPDEYELSQNYPNPFNPSTIIRFSMPEAANVVLTVYNVLGQEIASLINQTMDAGHHEVQFDASNLNSGMYIYKLQAGNFVSIKKMMLAK